MSQERKKYVKITEEYCKACGYCIKVCPDKALELDEKFNSSGYHPVKWKGNCRMCGLCYTVCPDFAVEIDDKETS